MIQRIPAVAIVINLFSRRLKYIQFPIYCTLVVPNKMESVQNHYHEKFSASGGVTDLALSLSHKPYPGNIRGALLWRWERQLLLQL
jgi:hypothetical protein